MKPLLATRWADKGRSAEAAVLLDGVSSVVCHFFSGCLRSNSVVTRVSHHSACPSGASVLSMITSIPSVICSCRKRPRNRFVEVSAEAALRADQEVRRIGVTGRGRRVEPQKIVGRRLEAAHATLPRGKKARELARFEQREIAHGVEDIPDLAEVADPVFHVALAAHAAPPSPSQPLTASSHVARSSSAGRFAAAAAYARACLSFASVSREDSRARRSPFFTGWLSRTATSSDQHPARIAHRRPRRPRVQGAWECDRRRSGHSCASWTNPGPVW